MRKLATIRVIRSITPIPGADNIELAHVDGWQCVIKKGSFKVGESAIYCEIDSFIPHTIAPYLSKGKEPRVFNGTQGERLRTIKLRGTLSQGLLLPIEVAYPVGWAMFNEEDLTGLLGIQLWEPPITKILQADAKGNFPNFIQKTDQERIQNIPQDMLDEWSKEALLWEVTEKMDGTSITIFNWEGQIGVCSRNLELKEDADGTYWRVARESGIYAALQSGVSYAVQGELCGPGIQGNQYGLSKQMIFVFDIFDIGEQRYLLPDERMKWCKYHHITQVHIVDFAKIPDTNAKEQLLESAESFSIYNSKQREGLVFKSTKYHGLSFKVISNKWLEKHD